MNEMLYGNTGRRDEGINIDMEASLYQKLQSRTYVPKLKSMLNDALQEEDRNFVFIGEIPDRAGNYSVYGYNAKLQSDSRGGDYGHYIAVPLDTKKLSFNIENIKFLTEEGFIEYVNLKELNEEKRFSIKPEPMETDINAKKRIVNNLMELFMKVKKRKNVTFSFEQKNVADFSAKSAAILAELMTYLPFRMRKNISFVSHVHSSKLTDKLPDLINLAAYPSSCETKPHDCIAIDGSSPAPADGIFNAYIEKVFAMTLEEREEYFEKIYNQIELPAINSKIDPKSDLYLLDVQTKELWINGDATEAVKSIFASVRDVLNVYPQYLQIAKERLEKDADTTCEYIENEINSVNKADDLRGLYQNVKTVFDMCGFDIERTIHPMFKKRAVEIVNTATNDENFIEISDSLVSVRPPMLDTENFCPVLGDCLKKKTDLIGIHNLYSTFRDKQYVPVDYLDAELKEATRISLDNSTKNFTDSKGKLSHLERLFKSYKQLVKDETIPVIEEVYFDYSRGFSAEVNKEAIDFGEAIINEAEAWLRSFGTLIDVKDHIIQLGKIDVVCDMNLQYKTTDMYKRITDKFYDILDLNTYTYEDIKNFVNNVKISVTALNSNEIYDRPLKSGWGTDKIAYGGMFRFVSFFDELISGMQSAQELAPVLILYENILGKLTEDDGELKNAFSKYASVVLKHWMNKHPKCLGDKKYEKAQEEIRKQGKPGFSNDLAVAYRSSVLTLDTGNKSGNSKMYIKYGIIGAGVVLLVVLFLIFNPFKSKNNGKKPETAEKEIVVTEELLDETENYLAFINSVNFDKYVSEGVYAVYAEYFAKTDSEYKFIIKNNLDNDEFNNSLEAEYELLDDNSDPNVVPADKLKKNSGYIVIVQKLKEKSDTETETTESKYVIRGAYEYNPLTDSYAEKDNHTHEDEFFGYVGYKLKKYELKKVITDSQISDVENYLASVSDENSSEKAGIIYGSFERNEESLILDVEEKVNCGFEDKQLTDLRYNTDGPSKGEIREEDIITGKKYFSVVRKDIAEDGSKVYIIMDIFDAPEKLSDSEYRYNKDKPFTSKILKYVGYKLNKVTDESGAMYAEEKTEKAQEGSN